jgi:hypothetical protein
MKAKVKSQKTSQILFQQNVNSNFQFLNLYKMAKVHINIISSIKLMFIV